MQKIKKNIVCFGANSFLAKAFFEAYEVHYNILKIYRSPADGIHLDFTRENDLADFDIGIMPTIDAVIFFQGSPPSVGFHEMSFEHFMKMLTTNLSMPAMVIKKLFSKLAEGCSVIFFSSVASKKGSYDPCYAAAKSALTGLIHSLANACPKIRFNQLSLGLVEDSPVHRKMSEDFIKKHSDRMFRGRLVNKTDVARMINELIINSSLNRDNISVDGGYL